MDKRNTRMKKNSEERNLKQEEQTRPDSYLQSLIATDGLTPEQILERSKRWLGRVDKEL